MPEADTSAEANVLLADPLDESAGSHVGDDALHGVGRRQSAHASLPGIVGVVKPPRHRPCGPGTSPVARAPAAGDTDRALVAFRKRAERDSSPRPPDPHSHGSTRTERRGRARAGGIGVELNVAFQLRQFDTALTIIILILVVVLLVERLSSHVRTRLISG